MSRLLTSCVALAGLALLAAGCSQKDDNNYLEVVGGGFTFNYRIAEAKMVLVAAPLKDLPDSSTVEASFENPAGGQPLIVSEKVRASETKYELDTPPLSGIKADKPYVVTLRLLDASGKELQRIDTPYKSSLDQSVLPEKPLVVGPVYTPNPELKQNQSGG